MALTLGEAITKAIKLIDEYSINGKTIVDSKNADYLNKMKDAADTVQMELAKIRKIPSIFEITQKPLKNLLSDKPSQKMVYHTTSDITYSCVGGLSFYFEVDNVATIYIKQGATILQTINNVVNTSFQAYKDFIVGADPTQNISLVFSGNTSYGIKNIAIYGENFPTQIEIPRYAVKRRYTLPLDFMAFDRFDIEDVDDESIVGMDYRWEKPNVIILDYEIEATIRVSYFRYPSRITEATPLDYTFDLVDEASHLIPYYLAWNSKSTEDPPLASQFRRIYEVMAESLEKPKEQGIVVMEDVNNW